MEKFDQLGNYIKLYHQQNSKLA